MGNILKSIFNQTGEWSNLMSDLYDLMTERNIRTTNKIKFIPSSVHIFQLLKRAEDETLAQVQSQSVFVIECLD